MKKNMYETLDAAIEQLRNKEPLPNILQRHPDKAPELLSLLKTVEALDFLAPVEMPSRAAMQVDKNEFLRKAAQAENSNVSSGWLNRIKEWTGTFIHCPQISLSYPQKEKWNMSAILVRTILVIGLFFGTTGGVYAMTDNSLPNEPMYKAKLAMEQVRLNMASDPAGIATQHMSMAQNRTQEIVRMAQEGTPPDAGTITRLEYHLNNALQFTAQLENESEMLGVLTQARAMVQEQVQAMNRFQVRGEGPLQEQLQLALQLLNQFQQRIEAGLQDPQTFCWQYQRGQFENSAALDLPGGNPDCPLDDCVPVGDEHKYGHSEENPPGQPGGNPDCQSDDCIPEGDEHKYGQSEENPPGQPGGNPDCTCNDCVPEGDEHQYGQTDEEAPGQPGGNPDCPSDDCVPMGDQNGPNRP